MDPSTHIADGQRYEQAVDGFLLRRGIRRQVFLEYREEREADHGQETEAWRCQQRSEDSTSCS